MKFKLYKRTKTKFSSKFNLLFSLSNSKITPTSSTTKKSSTTLLYPNLPPSSFIPHYTPLSTAYNKNNNNTGENNNVDDDSASAKKNKSYTRSHKNNKQNKIQNFKKKGKDYNGGSEVDEESPMLEEVVAPSK